MTQRTWMGFRPSNGKIFSMIDPAGSISPVVGGYSVEFGLLNREGELRLATRGELKIHQYHLDRLPIPVTDYTVGNVQITVIATVSTESPDTFIASIFYQAPREEEYAIVIGIRPFNVEGASPIYSIMYSEGESSTGIVEINEIPQLLFFQRPTSVHASSLQKGDAYFTKKESTSAECSYGVGTAALHYLIQGKGSLCFAAHIYDKKSVHMNDPSFRRRNPMARLIGKIGNRHAYDEMSRYRLILKADRKQNRILKKTLRKEDLYKATEKWRITPPSNEEHAHNPSPVHGEILQSAHLWERRLATMASYQSARPLWNEMVRIMGGHLLSLQSGNSITPGIYTYNQFWFRDAAYMLYALLLWGFQDEVRKVIVGYPAFQNSRGFFKSHEGEWDSNGQAIWIIMQYIQLTGDTTILEGLYPSIQKGVRWIEKKRKSGYKNKLLPVGFSAEHLGPADYYYWDNLWSIAGIRSAAELACISDHREDAKRFLQSARSYETDLLQLTELSRVREKLVTGGPNRPVDAGMIGTLCAVYPLNLQIFPQEQMKNTIETLYREFFQENLFFHPIIHSGYNIYLSLHGAQSLFRLGDFTRARDILKAVIRARSALFTYPEAIHPRSGGGAMGDGFHGWAFAELLSMFRTLLVHEEDEVLHLFPGMKKKELLDGDLRFGPFPLTGGSIGIRGRLTKGSGSLQIEYRRNFQGPFTHPCKELLIHLPLKGRLTVRVQGGSAEWKDQRIKIREPEENIFLQYSLES